MLIVNWIEQELRRRCDNLLRLLHKLRGRLAVIDPDNKRIAYGVAWVAGFVAIGKLAAAARDIAIAWRYGVAQIVDAYQLASTIVLWLPSTLVASLMIVLVPLLVRVRHQAPQEGGRFFGELKGLALVGGVGVALVGVVIGSILLPVIAGSLSAHSREMAWRLTLGLLSAAPLTLLIGVYSARLISEGRHINTLLEIIPALAIVCFVLAWPTGPQVEPLLLGTLIGIAGHAVWISRVSRSTTHAHTPFLFSQRSPYWTDLYKAARVMVAGQIAMGFITPLDQFTAAQLGDGAIATLTYATRIVGLLAGVGALAFARSALPVMSQLQAKDEGHRAHQLAIKWSALMFAVGAIAAGIAWLLAPWAIALLFERGAFTSQDTHNVVVVLRWGLIQVPFYFSGLVLVQLLASQAHYRVIALFAASNLAVKVLLNIYLSTYMGVPGIALATGLMYAWSATCLFWATKRVRPTYRKQAK